MPITDHNLVLASLGLSLLSIIAIIWMGIRLAKLDKVRKQFFSSSIKKDFEQVLVDQNRSITTINQRIEDLDGRLIELTTRNYDNIKKIGFVRYNHIDGSGGNLSFALAMLNDHGDGMVISSLHGRDGIRLYGKEIKNNKSESKLTEEETEAIKNAK